MRITQEALKLAKLTGIKEAILKQESSSCGCGRVYRGPVHGVAEWDGVVAALLKQHGIAVMSEENLRGYVLRQMKVLLDRTHCGWYNVGTFNPPATQLWKIGRDFFHEVARGIFGSLSD